MKTLIIAEIGWNHMGNMNLAEKMIVSAAKNGADICKFQTWSEGRLKAGEWDTDGRREIYQKAQLTKEQHIYLRAVCEKQGVQFLTSVFDTRDLEFLVGLDISMIKIPSHEVYNIDLIQSAAHLFDEILVSTGAAKWEEIAKIPRTVDASRLVLMHCVSAYPCPGDRINLPRMEKLKELSKKVGYSGHYHGIDDSIAAICHGASYVEKHFTIDQELPGRDNRFAILPEQLRSLSDFRGNYARMNIDRGLDLQDCELDTYNNYRGRWSKNA